MSDTTETESKRPPPAPIMPGAVLCTILQAAALVCRGERWVYEALADGRIRGVKSDRRTLIVVKSLHDYVAGLPSAYIKPSSRQRKRNPALVASPPRHARRARTPVPGRLAHPS